jgi:U3 small nucleolar RNA-associated protein 20
LLLHPHMWLRHISSRLIALYFARVIEAQKENEEKAFGTYFLMKPSRLFLIAASLCCQLKTQLTDDAASNLITQNIVFAICGVHSLMGQMECVDSPKFWSTLEQHEQGRFLKSFELLDSRKGRSMFLSLSSGVCNQKEQAQSKDIRYLIISYLLKRMGKVSLQMEAIQVCFPEVVTYNLLGSLKILLEISTITRLLFQKLFVPLK